MSELLPERERITASCAPPCAAASTCATDGPPCVAGSPGAANVREDAPGTIRPATACSDAVPPCSPDPPGSGWPTVSRLEPPRASSRCEVETRGSAPWSWAPCGRTPGSESLRATSWPSIRCFKVMTTRRLVSDSGLTGSSSLESPYPTTSRNRSGGTPWVTMSCITRCARSADRSRLSL